MVGFDLLAVVLGEKIVHRGALHMTVEVGGELPLSNGMGIRVVQGSDKFITLQVISKGINSKVSYNILKTPRKQGVAKSQVKKGLKQPVIKDYSIKEEELF